MENTMRPGIAKRAVATAFDFLFISLTASLLAWIIGEVYSDLGTWGSLIGSAFSLLYFGILNSSTGKGQTLGKRMLNLRVTHYNGTYLSFNQAVLRFSILWPPLINQHILSRIPGGYYIIAICIGVFVSTLILMLLNKSHAGLHDIVCNSTVTNSKAPVPATEQPLAAFTLGQKMLTTFMVVLCTGLTFFQMTSTSYEFLHQITHTLELFKEVKEVSQVSNNRTTNVVYSSDSMKTFRSNTVNINVWIDERTFATLPDNEFYRKYYVAVKPYLPRETEQVIFTFRTGYDIGVTQSFRNVTFIKELDDEPPHSLNH